MRKFIVTALILGLVAGSLSAPALAKKKKPRKAVPVSAEQKFFLRNTTEDCAPESYQLLLTDGVDTTTCGSHLGGLANEVLLNVGEEPCEPLGVYPCGNVQYTAAEGLPLVLDATKEIKGMIAVGSWASEGTTGAGNGIGQSKLVVQVTGTKDGEPILLGESVVEYTVAPNQDVYEHEFAIKLDAALDKAQLTGLALNLLNRGASVEHSWYSLDDPASYLTVSAWK